jgi:hypothetical protein
VISTSLCKLHRLNLWMLRKLLVLQSIPQCWILLVQLLLCMTILPCPLRVLGERGLLLMSAILRAATALSAVTVIWSRYSLLLSPTSVSHTWSQHSISANSLSMWTGNIKRTTTGPEYVRYVELVVQKPRIGTGICGPIIRRRQERWGSLKRKASAANVTIRGGRITWRGTKISKDTGEVSQQSFSGCRCDGDGEG